MSRYGIYVDYDPKRPVGYVEFFDLVDQKPFVDCVIVPMSKIDESLDIDTMTVLSYGIIPREKIDTKPLKEKLNKTSSTQLEEQERVYVVTQLHEVKVRAHNSDEAAWVAKLLLNPNRPLNRPVEIYLVGSVQIHDVVVKEEK